jgi:hypothetical protein
MSEVRPRVRRWLAFSLIGGVMILALAFAVFRGDLIRYSLDPKTPFQTYKPPPAPDYAQRAAWSLLPANPEAPTSADPPADVFFVSPTTYEGGREWNGPIGDARSDRVFRSVMAPNYAGPFVRVGRIFAPRYPRLDSTACSPCVTTPATRESSPTATSRAPSGSGATMTARGVRS